MPELDPDRVNHAAAKLAESVYEMRDMHISILGPHPGIYDERGIRRLNFVEAARIVLKAYEAGEPESSLMEAADHVVKWAEGMLTDPDGDPEAPDAYIVPAAYFDELRRAITQSREKEES